MAKILIPIETSSGERRVSATPEVVKKLTSLGCEVFIESSAGKLSGFSDLSYKECGGHIVGDSNLDIWGKADIVFCVQTPSEDNLIKLKKGAILLGLLDPYGNKDLLKIINNNKISALSLELLPRISRAQSSDVLSSQANIAGYKSVLLAASELDRYFPMLMTAAGTVQPAKVVVLGGGVAGLQAVATAKRLGAIVFVSDIRPAVKEQVESLGAKFIEVSSETSEGEGEGGYAKETSEEYKKLQQKLIHSHIIKADAVITTALIPGRSAPVLIPSSMVEEMKPGSVIIDLAAENGGNCELTKVDESISFNGIEIDGTSNIPGTMPVHASELYSKNVAALLTYMTKNGELNLDLEDEIISGSMYTHLGEITNGSTKEALEQ